MKETFSKKEMNYGFLPELNLSFISDIKNQMNSIMNQQIQMMNAINSMLNESQNVNSKGIKLFNMVERFL